MAYYLLGGQLTDIVTCYPSAHTPFETERLEVLFKSQLKLPPTVCRSSFVAIIPSASLSSVPSYSIPT